MALIVCPKTSVTNYTSTLYYPRRVKIIYLHAGVFLSEIINNFFKYKALFQTSEHDQYCAKFESHQVTAVLLLARI